MDTEQLNARFGIRNHVIFKTGAGGLPFISVRNRHATALVSLHGGQILSYEPVSQTSDVLFLSKKSFYEDGKAIRGGIPVCWPWFGPDPKGLQRPNHGFVRTRLWEMVNTQSTTAESRIRLQFTDSQKQENTWRHPFRLELDFSIGETLSMSLTTHNTGDKTFAITQAFHTYFRIGDIGEIQVQGLENCRYFDKLDQGREKLQTGPVTVNEEVDRIYEDVDNHVVLVDPVLQRRITIDSKNCKTGVVWNPWEKSSKKMADLGNRDYRHFVCVETGNIAFDLIQIPPGGQHSLLTSFVVDDLL